MKIIKSIKINGVDVKVDPIANELILRAGGEDGDVDAEVAMAFNDYVGAPGPNANVLYSIIQNREDTDDGFTTFVGGRKIDVVVSNVRTEKEGDAVKYVAEDRIIAVMYSQKWYFAVSGGHDFSWFEEQKALEDKGDALREEVQPFVDSEVAKFVSRVEVGLEQFGEVKDFSIKELSDSGLYFDFSLNGVPTNAYIRLP